MSVFPCRLGAVLFDLDGVLTDTAQAHFVAWKRLADQLGIPFDHADNEALKGVDRMGSLDLIIARSDKTFGESDRPALAARKNQWYQAAISDFSPAALFPGAWDALQSIRDIGLAIALCSASRNAPSLIEQLGIAHFFDTVVDPATLAHGKPAPDIFQAAAATLGVPPAACLGIEDASAGIAAIRAAGMPSLGIGNPAGLPGADRVIASIAQFQLKDYYAV